VLEVSFECEEAEGMAFLEQNKDTLLHELAYRFDGTVSLLVNGVQLTESSTEMASAEAAAEIVYTAAAVGETNIASVESDEDDEDEENESCDDAERPEGVASDTRKRVSRKREADESC
ncbi:MAG: hypothetical protein P8104_02340, partial [Gammaproteobacteria bacterium]